ncbi:DUF4394 domain-containing protein [Massilia niabensis]|uniref:DUF4394 domain-containing protein n=1 Tax=Massilia niabensis TaxID=544910 RepID=A0ABW0LAB4_9BURK
MNNNRFPKLILASSIALALAACGGSDDDGMPAPTPAPTPAPPMMSAGDVFAITVSNKLVSFNRDAPATVRTSVDVVGLQAGENLAGIDFRPADGVLYGVGSSGRIYTINTATGLATLKSTLAADATDTTAPFTALSGSDYGVDFNPAADRLRVVSNTGQSLRINVDSGATTTDGAINGGAANAAVTASAYTNSFAGTGTTTLYALDTANDTLYVQNPPNNGTLSLPVALGVDAGAVNGLDIDARTNLGYAVLTVGGARTLYTINLAATSAAATAIGALGINEDIRGIALRAAQAPLAYGLTDDARLVSFKPGTPNVIDTSSAVTGLNTGETLLGIDFRPRDALLYGLTSAGRIVSIDPATGAATVKASLAADPADTSSPYAGIVGAAFAVDFNPVADRLRVISDTGQNLRINVDTGATTTDGAVNRAGATPLVTAGAYTNSIAGATTTTLYDIDNASASLAMQNPPNDGTLTLVGPLGVAVAGDVAMDIAGGANGLVLAALRTAPTGPSTLYRIDLATGAATPVNGAANPATSAIGNGQVGLRDIAISIRQ